MKRYIVLQRAAQAGAIFSRHGAEHNLYQNPRTGAVESIPRHKDIKEQLAKKIIRNLSIGVNVQERGSRGRERDSRGQERDSRGQERDSRGQERDSRGRERDSRGRERDSRGRERDSRGRERDSRGSPPRAAGSTRPLGVRHFSNHKGEEGAERVPSFQLQVT